MSITNWEIKAGAYRVPDCDRVANGKVAHID